MEDMLEFMDEMDWICNKWRKNSGGCAVRDRGYIWIENSY
jgi:hypothetical protein